MLKKNYVFEYNDVKIEWRYEFRPGWTGRWKLKRLVPNTFRQWEDMTFLDLPSMLVGIIDEERVPQWQERTMNRSGCS